MVKSDWNEVKSNGASWGEFTSKCSDNNCSSCTNRESGWTSRPSRTNSAQNPENPLGSCDFAKVATLKGWVSPDDKKDTPLRFGSVSAQHPGSVPPNDKNGTHSLFGSSPMQYPMKHFDEPSFKKKMNSLEALSRPGPNFGLHAASLPGASESARWTSLLPAKNVFTPDIAGTVDSSGNFFSLGTIVAEILNEFKIIRGEPTLLSERKATPGLELIRIAIRQNVRELKNELLSMKAEAEAKQRKKEMAEVKIKEAITSSRNKCIKCRMENLEELYLQYGLLMQK